MSRRGRGKASGRKTSKREGKKPKKAPKPEVRTVRMHPHGDVPMVTKTVTVGDESYSYDEYDPDFRPPLPPGAVRGNPRHQQYYGLFCKPRYFYLDRDEICVQCGQTFVFSAKEQKYWYESLGFPLVSVAVRCLPCRRRRRSQKALREELARCLRALEAEPDDFAQHLALAEATVRYRRSTGEGDLDRAIHSVRRVQKGWPEAAEAYFWEGACHAEADREAKARELYQRFLEHAGAGRGRRKKWAKEARAYLEGASGGPGEGKSPGEGKKGEEP